MESKANRLTFIRKKSIKKNLQAQQTKLNKFVKKYNKIRPHESIDMRIPAAVHRKSDRTLNDVIEKWNYPKECIVIRVTNNGAVWIGRGDWLFITSALAGKTIGFKEVGNKIYEIYYREFFLGYADLKKLKVFYIMKYKDELKL